MNDPKPDREERPVQVSSTDDLRANESRQRADEAAAHFYEPMKGEVIRSLRAKLSRRGLRIDSADLEAFYNDAWITMHEALCRGALTEASGGFLVEVAFRRTIDEIRRTRPRLRDDRADVDRLGGAEDPVEAIDNRDKIRVYLEALGQVSARGRKALILCKLHGYTRPAAAGLMGIPPKRMEKIMDEAQAKLRSSIAAIEDGRWCDRYKSPLGALAVRFHDEKEKRYRSTIAHLRACPACRAELHSLRKRLAIEGHVSLMKARSLAARAT